MDNPTQFFGAISALIGVGTAIYSFLKARKEYHAACEQNATDREPRAAPVRMMGFVKSNTIAIAIAALLLLFVGAVLLQRSLSLRQQSDRLKKQNDVKEQFLKQAHDAEARGDTKAAEKAMRDMDEALKALDRSGK